MLSGTFSHFLHGRQNVPSHLHLFNIWYLCFVIFSGVDIAYKIKQEVAKSLGIKTTLQTRFMNGERYCALNDRLFSLGRLGRKTGMYVKHFKCVNNVWEQINVCNKKKKNQKKFLKCKICFTATISCHIELLISVCVVSTI